MSKKKMSNIGISTSTRTAYVGKEIYEELLKDAIEISYVAGQQITASQFLKYIAINFREIAKKRLLDQTKKDEAVQA